jgi:hypothetical protein
MSDLNNFRDELIPVIGQMDGVVAASAIQTDKAAVIGVELDDGNTVFVEIQPA